MKKEIEFNIIKEKMEKIMHDENIPKIIYKYMPINEYTFKNLLNNQILFSSPKDFNDPFDCKMFKIAKPSRKNLEDYFKKLNKTSEQINNITNDYYKNPEDNLKHAQETVKKDVEDYSIACFSCTKENILMWSHYSDNHKGICLTFDSLNLFKKSLHIDKTILNVLRVKYVPDYPEINYFIPNKFKEEVYNMFKYKYNFWDKEKEVRFISEKRGLISFNKEALLEINFGCKLEEDDPDDNRKKIIELVELYNYPNVKFLQATKCEDKFGLNFKKIDI
ncbi:MAG: DUF2971 domain-containing protein [Candidatus Cloacimonetes bacterium]|nr:DUF2971 domain-containing protein [Candidatus Cloacimonadota bacterium]